MRKKRINEIAEDLAECNRLKVPYELYQRGSAPVPPQAMPEPQDIAAIVRAAVEQALRSA
jgi:hypothetical protein